RRHGPQAGRRGSRGGPGGRRGRRRLGRWAGEGRAVRRGRGDPRGDAGRGGADPAATAAGGLGELGAAGRRRVVDPVADRGGRDLRAVPRREQVRLVAFSFVVALLVTALLYPLVAALVRIGVHRTLATLLVLLLGFGMLALVGWFVSNQVSANAGSLAAQINDVGDRIPNWRVTAPLPRNARHLPARLRRAPAAITQDQGAVASRIFATAGTAAEAVAGILLVIFTTFFLLRDGPLVWAWVVRLFPT